MDFKDNIILLAERLKDIKVNISTEEATKNALIMPFIQMLGYDVFNPLEVVPEFVADIGIKKGEKVDYAILKEGKPTMLIECKNISETLDVHSSQLFRYFHTTKAKFGILTNGIEYRFYTDLNESNKMDEKPFLSFEITSLNNRTINEIKKFHKSYFDVDEISETANVLKYSKEIKNSLENELNESSDDFVRYFAHNIYSGRVTSKIVEMFTPIVHKAFSEFIKDKVDDRLKSALSGRKEEEAEEDTQEEELSPKIITTEEEIQAFYIIKSIVIGSINSPEKVCYRDTQSYFGILYEDNNRKPICRIKLDGAKKYIILFDENKKETKNEIENLDDIYKYSAPIISICNFYEQ